MFSGSIRALLILAAISLPLVAGLNPETGDYVFQRYVAKQYGGSAQNFASVQDPRGVMYFANAYGLLEFDGTSWRKLSGSIVRSVNIDGKGNVYFGGVGEFGVLKSDATGTVRVVSLSDQIPKEDRTFADVWRVLPTPQGVYFSSYSRLFRVDGDGRVQTWRPQKKFGRAFYILNALYVQSTDVGLLKMGTDDHLNLIEGGERFAGASEVPAAAAAKGDDALMLTPLHLYRMTGRGAQLFPTAADAFLVTNLGFSLQIFNDREIAVGTRKGGLVLIKPDGSLDRILSTASGSLPDDFVKDITVDRQGGVWLAQDNGVARVNPSLSVYGKAEGLEGDVQSVARQGADLYAGTSVGIFRLNVQAGRPPEFLRVEGANGSTYALLPYGKDLLAGTDVGAFLISGSRAVKIFDTTRTVLGLGSSSHDPDSIYLTRKTAVTVLTQSGSKWNVVTEFNAAGQDFNSVVEDADGRVWATSNGNVWRIDFGTQPVRAERFSTQEGIPTGFVTVRRISVITATGRVERIVFATAKGLKRFDEQQKRFVPDSSLGSQFSDGSRDVIDVWDDAKGNVWVTGESYHGTLLRQGNGYKWYAMPLLRSGIQEIYAMSTDPDGTAWVIGADTTLYRYERAIAADPDNDLKVLTRRIQVSGKEDWYGGAGPIPTSALPWKNNNLRFQFAAPFYEEPSTVEYQVQLEGSDNDWTSWSHETQRDYTHLSEGSYKFHIRARTPHGTVVEDSSVGFGILPPWYRTWWAYTTYVFFGGFGIWGIVGVRTRQLEADKRRLEGIVDERTAEVRKQRDEIQVEQEKSQSLLLNILPAKVADELKTTGSVQPVTFDDVTVCFTDFVGFTVSSEKMDADHLVHALNEYFTRFDEIVARHGLEKLKTIGDSYMFASGLPAARKSHAVDAVLAAREMVEVVQEFRARQGGTGWNIRVGLHSGPVVAGVVGTKKFAFDIWGNTVNFAARMESSGVPGRVNMSEHTCELTRGLIECEARGNVKIKEGRELPMFLAGAPVGDIAERYRAEFGEEMRGVPVTVGQVATMPC